MTARSRLLLSFVTNLALLPTGVAMVVSGFAMQFGYHIGHHGSIDASRVFWGMDFAAWSATHKTSIMLGALLTLVHVRSHWRWLQAVVSKRLFAKNWLTVTLTTLFVAAAVTGYIPWIVDLADGSASARKVLIEVHDKLTLALSVCLAIHVVGRVRWFFVNAGPSVMGKRLKRGIT
jgi:hypothetical protein